MERCAYTNLTKPECSCGACLRELLAKYAPRPNDGLTVPPASPADSGKDKQS
jgi:hypothetical protein